MTLVPLPQLTNLFSKENIHSVFFLLTKFKMKKILARIYLLYDSVCVPSVRSLCLQRKNELKLL